MAVEIRVPAGDVPTWEIESSHLEGRNVTEAGFAAEVWLPESYRFQTQCKNRQFKPGQGRWPFGLWVGGWGDRMGDAVALSEQDGVTIRLNRDGGSDGQLAGMGMYVYNLNRQPGLPTGDPNQCEASGVCASSCSRGSNGACNRFYGYWNPTNVTKLPRGRWVPVEMKVRMNDPGRKNGTVTLWRDGALMQDKSGFDFGRDRGWFLQGFSSWEMWHCQASPQSQSYWFRNLRLYSNDVTSLRIDAGNSRNYAPAGVHAWMPDRSFSGGDAVDAGSVAIAGTSNPRLYQTARRGTSRYAIPLRNGTYNVKLLFAETDQAITAAGQRVIDIAVEDRRFAVDIFREAGRNRALVRSVDVDVRDNLLNINVAATAGTALIAGIDVNSR